MATLDGNNYKIISTARLVHNIGFSITYLMILWYL